MKTASLLPLVTLAVVAAGCSSTYARNGITAAPVESNMIVLEAKIEPTACNQCHGVVRFYQQGDSVRVVADLDGLAPNQQHGFHIHEKGDCSAPDASSAGGHYNPEGSPHALPPGEPRHAGDLGNVTADGAGHAHYEVVVGDISLNSSIHPIMGRAVIVHAQPDDGGQPTGNAGARVGCGVIDAAKLL
jgi:Cu-Zn family superoxide dismutase